VTTSRISLLLGATVLAACQTTASATIEPGPRTAPPPRNSLELQAAARSEAARFEAAVSTERKTPRLEVEAISSDIVVDRARSLVYLAGSELVALDLATGAIRWKRPDVHATSFARVGLSLVAVGEASRKKPLLWFLSLAASPVSVTPCALSLSLPPEADEVSVVPFDRAGVPYVFFASRNAGRRGGPPPSPQEVRRSEAGNTCGVVQLSPTSCQATPVALRGLMLDPPRDGGAAVEIEPTDCRYLSPGFSMPAVVASSLPAISSLTPRLKVVKTELPPDGCVRLLAVRLDATNERGSVLWSHALPEEWDRAGCPGPP